MKKVVFILLVLFFSKSALSQNPLTPFPNDLLYYDSKSFPHYGLGWVTDSWQPGGPSAWLTGFGGLKFFTLGQPRMGINSSGKVGIGTMNPTHRLHVNGSLRVDCTTEGGYGGLFITTETNGPYLNGSMSPNTIGGMDIVSANSSLSFSTTGIKANGNLTAANKLMIGSMTLTEAGAHSLAVNGSAIFNKIIVRTYPAWPDYVFEKGYKLRSLSSLESFINENKHLPDVPTAAEIEKNGIDVSEVQAALLKKVEELTLYVIEQNKRIESQGTEIKKLKLSNKK